MKSAVSTTRGVFASCREFMEMIKVAHTLFAMPFAIGAVFLANRDDPVGSIELAVLLAKVTVAVALARTAAMAFNRWADRSIDALNPRTSDRSIPAGRIGSRAVLISSIISCAGFIAVTASINTLAWQLSPVVLLVILGYSWTKRFTSLCHLVLGLGLGLAPVGAWIAVRGSLLDGNGNADPVPWILGGAVMLWSAGFDILYGCQDAEFDRQQGLHSIPARIGVGRALRLSSALHFSMAGLLCWLWVEAELGLPFALAALVVTILLIVQHRLVKPDDLGKVQRAFFTLNAIISVLLMAALILEGIAR